MKTITETLHTPLEDAGDVVVAGAGSAGIAAAIAAARSGCRVTLIDPAGFPGGTLVSGIPLLGCHDGKRQVVRGFFHEMIERLAARGGCDGDPRSVNEIKVDPEKLKVLLIEMLAEAGVMLRLHTLLVGVVREDERVRFVIVEGKGGRRALAARFFVDATGDADLAALAGVPCEVGRQLDGLTQPASLVFSVAHVDVARFEAWGGARRMDAHWAEVSAREGMRNPRRSHVFGTIVGSRPGEMMFNVTRVLDCDGADSVSLSRAELEGRLQAWEFLDRFLRPHVPGFEHSYIATTAAKIGVRETRRIVGHYVLTRDDIWDFVKFPDAINYGAYPIDIHSPTGGEIEIPRDHFYGGRHWTIPYRSLVPVGVDNLLVAGRCLSATHEALAAVRCMPNTLGMGEAAGLAVGLALQTDCAAVDIDVTNLQAVLRSHGAWLGDSSPD